ncbi:hypothetical protein [Desulfogranum mediterraneum]|uniref:hypothetical protein n=1 Tax=Desulfogranum mediterraneum TaxID=160661 RepID=UPI0004105906|nr:hypothetical protein [Desulfogranum mediterraneum]
MGVLKDRYKREAVEVHCVQCKRSQIIYLPEEEIPLCPLCRKRMVIKENLTEGKY